MPSASDKAMFVSMPCNWNEYKWIPLCVSSGRYVIKHIRSHFGSSVSAQFPLTEPPAVKFPRKGSQTTKRQSKQLINQTINNQLFIFWTNCGVVANLRHQNLQRQTFQRACWPELASPLQPYVWWQRVGVIWFPLVYFIVVGSNIMI